ncbi:17278_t:CDS:1, partial [Acaulospora colombiana]
MNRFHQDSPSSTAYGFRRDLCNSNEEDSGADFCNESGSATQTQTGSPKLPTTNSFFTPFPSSLTSDPSNAAQPQLSSQVSTSTYGYSPRSVGSVTSNDSASKTTEIYYYGPVYSSDIIQTSKTSITNSYDKATFSTDIYFKKMVFAIGLVTSIGLLILIILLLKKKHKKSIDNSSSFPQDDSNHSQGIQNVRVPSLPSAVITQNSKIEASEVYPSPEIKGINRKDSSISIIIEEIDKEILILKDPVNWEE